MRIRLAITRYSPRKRTANTRLVDLHEIIFWLAALGGVIAIVWVA